MRKYLSNPFFLASTMVFMGSTAANVLNYLYNLVMGRLLDPASYGEVAVIVTMSMIAVVPSTTLMTLGAKYIAGKQAKQRQDLSYKFFQQSKIYSWILGIIFFGLYMLCVPWLAEFFKIEKLPLAVFGLYLPMSLLIGTSKGALQGFHEFKNLSLVNIIEALMKLVFSLGLVWVGLNVAGAIGGIVAGTALAYMYGNRVITRHKPEAIEQKSSLSFALPEHFQIIFWSSLFLAVFGNIDVILAKHYLNEFDAGQYAALAVLGRVVTYASIAVITVLLPMASAAKANQDSAKSKKLLWLSVLGTLLVSAAVVAVFSLFPELTVKTLFGAEYLPIAQYLGIFSLIMLIGSLSKVFVNYFLATHQNAFILPFASATAVQIYFVILYHSTIQHIIRVLLFTNIMLLLSMLIIYVLFRSDTASEKTEQIARIN